MLFNSLAFLVFLPLFLTGFYLVRGRARLLFTLAGSYLFYGWWDWRFLGLILLSTVVDYTAGLAISRHEEIGARRRALTASVVTNLSILGFFKYANFFVDSLGVALTSVGIHVSMPTLHVILPVGVSFYTFQTMSYTIDLYRGRVEVERDFLRFATFVAFFPQLVAGPIVRAADLLPQLRRGPRWSHEDLVVGLGLVLLGFAKKVVVADSLALVVDRVFEQPGILGAPMLVVGVIFYAFQIYCDFSGYSDIAIGLGRILGFHFPWNFDRPYFSRSFSEFWSRWHITLSGWLRDYLYIPLGGNRMGTARTFRNLMITMFLGGLWHGAGWTFVFWGVLHGLYLVVQRVVAPRPKGAGPRMEERGGGAKAVAQIALVFTLTCVAWVFFRAPDFTTAWTVLHGIATWAPGPLLLRFELAKGAGLILLLVVLEAVSFRVNLQTWLARSPVWRTAAYAALLLLIAVAGTFRGEQFIYFQF